MALTISDDDYVPSKFNPYSTGYDSYLFRLVEEQFIDEDEEEELE